MMMSFGGFGLNRCALSAMRATATTATMSAMTVTARPVLAVVATASRKLHCTPQHREQQPNQQQQQQPIPTLTVPMACDIQRTHLSNLNNEFMIYNKQLSEIRNAKATLPFQVRWQAAMQIFMLSQLHVLLAYGYPGDDRGMKSFAVDFERLKQTDASGEMNTLTLNRHVVLIEQGFGVKVDTKCLSVESARSFASDISSAMSDNAFLDRVENETKNQTDPNEKHATISTLMIEKQMEVGEKHGFSGEEGYLQLQCALLAFAADQTVAYSITSGMMVVFRRAGIDLSAMA